MNGCGTAGSLVLLAMTIEGTVVMTGVTGYIGPLVGAIPRGHIDGR